MSRKQLSTRPAGASRGLQIVRETPLQAQVGPGMRHLCCVGRFRWPADWQTAVDVEFEQVTHSADAVDMFALLARDPTAMGMMAVDNSARPRSYDAFKDLDSAVRARVLVVAEVDRSQPAMMASAGVVDFVTPDAPWSEVVFRLQLRLYASYLAPFTRASATDCTDTSTLASSLAMPLTGKQHQLYLALARRIGQPVSRTEILRSVWNRDARTSAPSNLVDVYVLYLRQKLEVAAPHLEIATIRGVGYVLRERVPVALRRSYRRNRP